MRLRPVLRKHTPILYPIARMIMSSVCPRKTDDTVDLVVPYMGMRFNVNTGWSIERHILFTGEYERLIASIIERALNHGDRWCVVSCCCL